MRSERFEFYNAKGEKLAAVFDPTTGRADGLRAVRALLPCGKDNLALTSEINIRTFERSPEQV